MIKVSKFMNKNFIMKRFQKKRCKKLRRKKNKMKIKIYLKIIDKLKLLFKLLFLMIKINLKMMRNKRMEMKTIQRKKEDYYNFSSKKNESFKYIKYKIFKN